MSDIFVKSIQFEECQHICVNFKIYAIQDRKYTVQWIWKAYLFDSSVNKDYNLKCIL